MNELLTPQIQVQNEHCAGECTSCASVGSCADRVVCRCLKIAETTVINAIRTGGATTVRELKTVCGAGGGCLACHSELKKYLKTYASSDSPSMCCAR